MTQTSEPTVANWNDVPGFNNDTHLENLKSFVSSIPENSKILEIGCAWGGSSWALMDGLPEGCELHICDTFGMNNPQLKQHHYQGVMKKHSHNPTVCFAMDLYMRTNQRTMFDWCVRQHPRYKEVVKAVYQMPSLSVLAKNSNWDLVYIDGLHSYENVSLELEYCKDVPFLCGDDYHPVHEGCKKAIDEFISKYPDKTFYHDTFESGSGFWSLS